MAGATAREHSEPTREEMADAGARFPLHKRSRPESEAAVLWSGKQQRLEGQPRDHTYSNTRDARSVFGGGERDDYEEAAGRSATVLNHSDVGDDQPMTASLLQTLSASASASYFTWRLPANQGLDASEQYLNEQLVHVAGSAAFEMSSTARATGLGGGSDPSLQGDEAAICKLNLTKSVWGFISAQTAYTAVGKEKLQKEKDEAEKSVRETMDLISLLLYLRSQELVRQNEMGERLQMLEKELQRRKHQVQALTGELENNKQNLAQQENYFRAKELAFMNERKTLQTEKKSLEVMVARLQGVETSFKAQLRRKDAEYERLRKNLQDSVARSSKEQRVSYSCDQWFRLYGLVQLG